MYLATSFFVQLATQNNFIPCYEKCSFKFILIDDDTIEVSFYGGIIEPGLCDGATIS